MLSLAILLLLAHGVYRCDSATTKYCASISPTMASGSSGWFAMQVSDGPGGLAYYAYNISISPTVAALCPIGISNGLVYHIHGTQGNTASSAAGSRCGSSSGFLGHYDPNLACSQFSQFSGTTRTTACAALRRNTTYGYAYTCSASTSATTIYNCEVGDLSGKFGLAQPSSTGSSVFKNTKSYITDAYPPLNIGFKNTAAVASNILPASSPWGSIIFHCNNSPTPTRLVCATFSNTELAPCASGFAAIDTANTLAAAASTAATVSQQLFNAAVASSVLICFFGGVCIAALLAYCYYSRSQGQAAAKPAAAKEEL